MEDTYVSVRSGRETLGPVHADLPGFRAPEFLFRRTPRIPKGVTIKEGVEILYGMYKAEGGLIRTVQEVEKSEIKEIGISGDFTLYPKEQLFALEESLRETERREEDLTSKIAERALAASTAAEVKAMLAMEGEDEDDAR